MTTGSVRTSTQLAYSSGVQRSDAGLLQAAVPELQERSGQYEAQTRKLNKQKREVGSKETLVDLFCRSHSVSRL